jgi:hypothetical protein
MLWKCMDIHGHEKIYIHRNRSDNEIKRNAEVGLLRKLVFPTGSGILPR